MIREQEVYLSFKVKWSENKFGSGSIILAGDEAKLVCIDLRE